jgi:general secretion pathway protein I
MSPGNDRAKGAPKRPSRAWTQSGFTLIEAIVAVAIIGVALIPILAFSSEAALRIRLIADSNARSLAQQNVMAYLETINPMDEPQGRTTFGDLEIAWASETLVVPNENLRIGTGLAQFSVGFYRVNVVVSRPSRPGWFDFTARKVGYRRIPTGISGGPPQ